MAYKTSDKNAFIYKMELKGDIQSGITNKKKRRNTLEYNVKSSGWNSIKFICHFNIKLEFTTKTIALTIVCLRLVQGT